MQIYCSCFSDHFGSKSSLELCLVKFWWHIWKEAEDISLLESASLSHNSFRTAVAERFLLFTDFNSIGSCCKAPAATVTVAGRCRKGHFCSSVSLITCHMELRRRQNEKLATNFLKVVLQLKIINYLHFRYFHPLFKAIHTNWNHFKRLNSKVLKSINFLHGIISERILRTIPLKTAIELVLPTDVFS